MHNKSWTLLCQVTVVDISVLKLTLYVTNQVYHWSENVNELTSIWEVSGKKSGEGKLFLLTSCLALHQCLVDCCGSSCVACLKDFAASL